MSLGVGDAGYRADLAAGRDDRERRRVGAFQGVGQRVVVDVRRGDGEADVRAHGAVLVRTATLRVSVRFANVGAVLLTVMPTALVTVVAATARRVMPLEAVVFDGVGAELHGEVRGRGCQGRRQGEFDLGSSYARRARRRGDAVGLDGDLGPIGRADVLAERQDHLRAVGRRRRRIGAGGDERRADAVNLVPGVGGERSVVEVGADGRAAGGPRSCRR